MSLSQSIHKGARSTATLSIFKSHFQFYVLKSTVFYSLKKNKLNKLDFVFFTILAFQGNNISKH